MRVQWYMHSEHSSLIYSFTIHMQQEKMTLEISAKIANVNGLIRIPGRLLSDRQKALNLDEFNFLACKSSIISEVDRHICRICSQTQDH